MPITLCRKIKEHSDSKLSSFIDCDVWVISGDKKGTHVTLHSIGRTTSLVVLFGHQLIQLRNSQIATPSVFVIYNVSASNTHCRTGLLLDSTILPAHSLRRLMSIHS